MYFWCHGTFVRGGAEPPSQVLTLSDGVPIDARTVRMRRRSLGGDGAFRSFVMLNACDSGVPAEDFDAASFGRALIREGAKGVLAPQIELPQVFAAEFALEFLARYLDGQETAGEALRAVARHFAENFHHPLGFTYGLHYGMDARLERSTSPADQPESATPDGLRSKERN
jgi:hypothetical protein